MADTLPNEGTPLVRRKVDCSLIPIKLHFILLYGAAGGVIPFLPVLGKQLGLTATAVGIVYTVQPLSILFWKPAFGALTDRIRNLKAVMIFLAIFKGITYSVILLIPPIEQVSLSEGITLTCSNNITTINVSNQYNQSCFDFTTNGDLTCKFQFLFCIENKDETGNSCNKTCEVSGYSRRVNLLLDGNAEVRTGNDTLNPSADKGTSVALATSTERKYLIYDFVPQLVPESKYSSKEVPDDNYDRVILVSTNDSICDCGDSIWNATSCDTNLIPCLLEKPEIEKSIYRTAQFWAFTFLVIISGSCAGALFTLSDAACYEILAERADLYGNQRSWATASWGLVSMLTGYLNEVASSNEDKIDYSPGFYLMMCMLFLDVIVLMKMKLTKANFTPTICKDVGRMFASAEIVAFTLAVFVIGGLSGLLWNYEFWYLQNLGASQFLLGLTVAVQCILAEVPFFFAAGYFIRTFGHFYCLVGSFAAYCLRYVLYFFLKNPWYVLPIDLLHGQTYATFYVTMTSFANTKAPPGTEATMFGILGGVFEGLGVGVGSLLSGLGFDHLGGRSTFLTAGVLSGICAIFFIFVRFALKSSSQQNAEKDTAADELSDEYSNLESETTPQPSSPPALQ